MLRSPISAALLSRRDAIRQELLDATNAREQALARNVAEADSMLNRLDDDVRTVHEQAQQEAESERQRQAAATADEMEKLKQQAAARNRNGQQACAERTAPVSREEKRRVGTRDGSHSNAA